METSDKWLPEIEAMARADHAHGLGAEYDPYGADTPQSRAWQAGWRAEASSERPLDEALALLPVYRIKVLIVRLGGGADEVLAEIDQDEELERYTVQKTERSGPQGALFRSREASARFPDLDNVAIRVDFEVPTA